ncbi:protein of unknown function [Algoriella xinjiangensis]|uniref:DUF4271 domain-containing protein n=1 Tax=Algoriella xinjiangensis TaxID=684065 RepID=A0A1I4U1S0_9FLAO|nr:MULTISPECIES: DUF4271 domain-containing protein [Algoriella]MBO6213623.1 DUF4271 domain-containing protein [Algoriella sp.]SFM82653.1 protein of unknown function [Algoriella xinjiangensis]VDH17776.1 Uncharacterised protein [Algoriella xinjiangensis]
MKTDDLISIGKNTLGNDTVLIILTVCLLLVCAAKYLFAKNFKTLNNKTEYMSFTDDNTTLFSFIVNGVTVLLISILLVSHFNISYNHFDNFRFNYLSRVGITFSIISIIMLFRLLIEVTFYRVFYESSSVSYFMKSSSFVNAKNVLLLLVICFLFFYTSINKEYLLIVGFILLFMNRIWEIYHIYTKQISNNKSIWYYNILYLCTLEILPIMVLAKLLIIGKVI